MNPPLRKFVVLKFGGTSISTPSTWRTILEQVEQRIRSNLRPLVVCSALSGVTNLLERLLARALSGQPEETLTEFRRRHVELGRQLGLDALAGSVIITQGFIAREAGGATVLLGGGGSDTSASYFAAKLGAVRCEIWTDVPGIFSADPRLIPDARLLRKLDYDEAQEVASMGAKVLHPRAIAPCRRHGIPMHLCWTERPNSDGTLITRDENLREAQVKAITFKAGVTLVSMETAGMWQQVGFLAEVFACFKALHLSIDLVSTSEMNVTVSLDPSANALDPAR